MNVPNIWILSCAEDTGTKILAPSNLNVRRIRHLDKQKITKVDCCDAGVTDGHPGIS